MSLAIGPFMRAGAGAGDPAPGPRKESNWQGQVPALAGKSVVVVEDEAITQLQIRRALARAGMKVVGFAADGKAGVETVLRTKPDLVVMDIKMPGSMNGLGATRLILQQLRTCVIVLTAYDEFEEEAREAGACGYVVKPVTFQTLVPNVQASMEKFYAA